MIGSYVIMRRALDILERMGAQGASLDTRDNDGTMCVSYPINGLGKPQTAFQTGRAAFIEGGFEVMWHSSDRNQIILSLRDSAGT